MTDPQTTTVQILMQYKQAAELTGHKSSDIANQSARRLHELYKRLRTTEEGRAAIVTLLSDTSPHVRCWAGAHALAWAPQLARRVLEELRDAKGRCSFDAEMILKQFDKGSLSFNH
ncbi:MAG: DUF2019 domain-containing protein [Chloroflexi bacterium]|nr:DUF2019 domain-containing protein [Chloroflexota bacterium]